MRTKLIISILISTLLHAESIPLPSVDHISTPTTATLDSSISSADSNISSSLFDVEEELTKNEADCMSMKDYEKLTGNYLKDYLATSLGHILLDVSIDSIGLEELRAVLKLPPPHPWQPYNWTEPSQDELTSAPTIEVYYDLKEPRFRERSLNGGFFETSVATAIGYLDKRNPSIRTVFRKAFEKTRRSHSGELSKNTVDRMIDEFFSTRDRIEKVIGDRDSRCRYRDRVVPRDREGQCKPVLSTPKVQPRIREETKEENLITRYAVGTPLTSHDAKSRKTAFTQKTASTSCMKDEELQIEEALSKNPANLFRIENDQLYNLRKIFCKCGASRNKTEVENMLTVSTGRSRKPSIRKIIGQFFVEEKVKIDCDSCKMKSRLAGRFVSIKHLPKYLAVSVRRYDFKNDSVEKVNSSIHINKNLYLKHLCYDSKANEAQDFCRNIRDASESPRKLQVIENAQITPRPALRNILQKGGAPMGAYVDERELTRCRKRRMEETARVPTPVLSPVKFV